MEMSSLGTRKDWYGYKNTGWSVGTGGLFKLNLGNGKQGWGSTGMEWTWCSGMEKTSGLGLTKPRGYSSVTRLSCSKFSQWAGISSAGNQTSGERLDVIGATSDTIHCPFYPVS